MKYFTKMTILIYWLGMLILCSGIGLLPLVIWESKKTINIISLYGAGLLVGVAFIVRYLILIKNKFVDLKQKCEAKLQTYL